MINKTLLITLTCLWATNATAAPNVVTSIAPVHSLVSGVMAGVGKPILLVKGNASPHTYSLKPSDAWALSRADIIFWVGPSLEGFLIKSIDTIGRKAIQVPLMDTEGLTRHELRSDHHHQGIIDPHIWLDPVNAKVMVIEIARVLTAQDPDHEAPYTQNRDAMLLRLDTLHEEIQEMLQPVIEQPFLVFHDGYQYFEKAFGLTNGDAITLDPETGISVQRRQTLANDIRGKNIKCLLSEPQFPVGLVNSLAKEAGATVHFVDPLNASSLDAAGYFDMMQEMARTFWACLSTGTS